jgi:hypothetical protein
VSEEAISTDIQPSQTETPTDAPAATEAPVEAAPAEAAAEGDESTILGAPAEVAAEGGEAPAGAPESYELTLEGMNLDPELVAEAEPVFRELGLSNDQANALLPLAPKIMEKAQSAVVQQLIERGAAQRKEWLDAFNADPTIGGGKREETVHLAAKGLDALGFKEGHPFRAALNETGFGNHPDMIRAFRQIGEMVSEDGLFVRENSGVRDAIPAHKALYPNET